jgi:putative ABC transport system ATP-binding protein
MALVVETINLTKIYGDGASVRALDNVNLRIDQGELVAVMGPSGSGKSTLLNMLGALDRPTSGVVCVNGQDLAKVRDLDRFRAHEIGFVFQLHNLIPTLTAAENVEVPMEGVGTSTGQRHKHALELLELVGLDERAHFLPSQLSGGQRQRVAIARALANDPSLILADEPTGNLDSTAGAELVELFQRLNREQGKTIIIVSHDPIVALSTQRIVTLRDGRIGQDEKVGDVYLAELDEIRNTALGRLLLGDEQEQAGAEAARPMMTLA